VKFRELDVPGAFEVLPQVFGDSRGFFYESFRADKLSAGIGHDFIVRQANTSCSQKGVLRGIHSAQVPMGQAKYVSVLKGSIIDFVVDLRVGSPKFLVWDSVTLSEENHHSVYVPEGCGHAFVSLEDNTVVNYLVSDIYRPEKEFGINPLDKEIGLVFPFSEQDLVISEKDMKAPTLQQTISAGVLTDIDIIAELYAQPEQHKGI
jgi:dTDP-4-dehydrorhamnose 3,5-epimerase